MRLHLTTRRLLATAVLAAGTVGAALPAATAAPAPEAGVFVDNDSASIIAGVVRLRDCLTNGAVNVEWKYNSTNNTTAAKWTKGCVTITRNGATQTRLLAEYRRANNTVILVKSLPCNKDLSVNPVHNCPINTGALDVGFTPGLDRVVLKLKSTSPAGTEVTQTVIVGD